uniref:RING-type domain-containing protein n=1 Tax=Neogobius melanostomus TaxID=47308 RepID=A0A8C6WIU0_9GOBI
IIPLEKMAMAFQPEDLSCSICQEVYDNPVVLSCSHSFCEDCIKKLRKGKPDTLCPICRRRLSRKDPIRNLALRDALYCLDDHLPVCVVCKESKTHELHHFRPIEEAAQVLRVKLEEDLTQLRDKLKLLRQFEKNCDLSLGHIKSQASQAKELIQNEFEKLHQFLVEEEESRMKALREEEERKTQRMKDKMAAVSREIEALSESIRDTEEQLRASDVSFLLQYKAAVERAQLLSSVVSVSPVLFMADHC